jgi:hypothetical protein
MATWTASRLRLKPSGLRIRLPLSRDSESAHPSCPATAFMQRSSPSRGTAGEGRYGLQSSWQRPTEVVMTQCLRIAAILHRAARALQSARGAVATRVASDSRDVALAGARTACKRIWVGRARG